MGSQHVPLTFNEDGLVTSVGSKDSLDIYETCVLCGKKTDVKITTHVDYRYGYVEGSGQCCRECYERTSEKEKEEDYATRVMRNRTRLITVSAEDILSTPNDQELGAKVRQAYWSVYGDSEPPIENQWICKYCGSDTSNVEYDYLSGTDHISCILATEMKG